MRSYHSSLKWLFQFKYYEGQLARRLKILSAYISNSAQTRRSTQECECFMSPVWFSDLDKDEIIAQSVIGTISENKVKAIKRDDPSSSLRAKQDEGTDVSLMKNRE